jgi:excisionase family DNA binding protein
MSEPSYEQGKLAYRVDEAVRASGLGRTFLYEHMASGELPSVKIGRHRLILHHELERFPLILDHIRRRGSNFVPLAV